MTVPKDFRYRYHRPVPSPPVRTRVAVVDGVGGDPEAADRAMRNHIRYGLDEMISSIVTRTNPRWRANDGDVAAAAIAPDA